MSKLAKLLKKVLSVTKRPELPEDHTWSQTSMAQQRAKGIAQAAADDYRKEAAARGDGARDLPDNASF